MSPKDEGGASLASGDLVLLDYDIWAEGGGRTELVGTTHAEVAQEAKIPLPEGETFAPLPHLLGGEGFPPGLENALLKAKVGETTEIELEPADGFGERDPKLIELFGMHEISRLPEMRREDAHLDIGTVLTIGGRRGRVVSLTAARVRVDFNPSFAGRKIRAKFTVKEKIVEPAERVRALVELTYGRSKEFHIEVRAGHVTLKVPDRAKFDTIWARVKPALVERVRAQLEPERITIAEEYVTPPKREPATKAEKPAEAPAQPAAPAEPSPPAAASPAATAPARAKKASSD